MPISSFFFLFLAAVFVVVGLFAATVAEGYFYLYSLLLIAFGLFYGYGIVKRYFDGRERA